MPEKPFERSRKLADLFGGFIDKPNDPSAQGSNNGRTLREQFNNIMPPEKGYTQADFGILQQNPQYRGIRMVLPQSGFTYQDAVDSAGMDLVRRGYPRIESHGPVGPPKEGDPHYNNIPTYPANYPPDRNGLREEFYGEMIKRGYPVYGGTGEFGGEFPKGFNPVGFGQR